MQETWVQSLGWEDPLEKGMATRSGNFAWEIPQTEDFSLTTCSFPPFLSWDQPNCLRLMVPPSGMIFKKTSAAAAKVLQWCPTLCDPIDGSPPGSTVPGILQARTLEWVAISFSSAWKWKVKSESEVAQPCPTLSDPTDCSQPGPSVHGILQARVLEWGAIAFSLKRPLGCFINDLFQVSFFSPCAPFLFLILL